MSEANGVNEVKVLNYEDWSWTDLNGWCEDQGCTKVCHGMYKIVDQEMRVWRMGDFEHGKQNGLWFYYDDDGNLEEVHLYKDDIRIDSWNREMWLEKCIREEL